MEETAKERKHSVNLVGLPKKDKERERKRKRRRRKKRREKTRKKREIAAKKLERHSERKARRRDGSSGLKGVNPAASVESVKEESALPTRVARRTILVGEVAKGIGLGRMAGGQGEEGTRGGKG